MPGALNNTEQSVKIKIKPSNKSNIKIDGTSPSAKIIPVGQIPMGVSVSTFSNNYEQLTHKPKINGHVLLGDISSEDLDLGNSSNGYAELKKIKDYLYETYYNSLDYSYAEKYFLTTKETLQPSACSAVRKGNYFGRNLDWFYDNNAEFIVKTPHANNRYATLGIASGIQKLTKEVVEKGSYNELYKIIPFKLVDGINEKRVVINTNVVPTDKGINKATIPVIQEQLSLCSSMIPRFVLDYFDSAREAANYLKNYVSIYPPKALEEMEYEVHWMIADRNETLLIEIINNEIIITDMTENSNSHLAGRSYMTNFYLSDVVLNFDGRVYTPAYRDGDHNAITYNHITEHGSGLERYNLIVNRYNNINSREDLRNLMKELYYTNTYKLDTNPIWCTEFVGINDLTVVSSVNDFMPVIRRGAEIFEHRTREEGTEYSGTWQTTHSVIYDIENKTMLLVTQEDNEAFECRYDDLDASKWGTNDYTELINKPKINNIELNGNKRGVELDLVNGSDIITNQDIEELFK